MLWSVEQCSKGESAELREQHNFGLNCLQFWKGICQGFKTSVNNYAVVRTFFYIIL